MDELLKIQELINRALPFTEPLLSNETIIHSLINKKISATKGCNSDG